MLRLYYAPHACSLPPHIALREAGLPFQLERVDFMRGKRLADGRNLDEVNPKGCIPALVLERGELLTEGVAILLYIADRAPERDLAPPSGSFARVRLHEWLNFIATELHKGIAPLYGLDTPEAYKPVVHRKLESKLSFVAQHLARQEFLLASFSVADAYLYYTLRSYQRVTRQPLPASLTDFRARVEQRPAVQAALAAEGVA
jgi:glutathione S-transferase